MESDLLRLVLLDAALVFGSFVALWVIGLSMKDSSLVDIWFAPCIATAAALGCVFRYPFETLSYLAMDVFPELKITEGGLRSPREAGPISLFR